MTAALTTLWLLVYASASPDGTHSWVSYIVSFPSLAECQKAAASITKPIPDLGGLKRERAHCLLVEIERARP